MRDVASVALGVYMLGGSADEGPEAHGSTHFLEHLLFKRSRRRTGSAIARMTDRLGGDCDAYTRRRPSPFTRGRPLRVRTRPRSAARPDGGPAFTADDVELEREVILERWPRRGTSRRTTFTTRLSGASGPRTRSAPPFSARREREGAVATGPRAAVPGGIPAGADTRRGHGAFEPGRVIRRLEAARDRARRREPGAPSPGPKPGAPASRRCLFDVPRPGPRADAPPHRRADDRVGRPAAGGGLALPSRSSVAGSRRASGGTSARRAASRTASVRG